MNFLEKFGLTKQKLIIGFAVLVSFALGFSVAMLRLEQAPAEAATQPHQSISQTNNTPITPYNQQKQTKTATTTPSCPVKGKVSKAGTKVYYLPGDSAYNRLKADKCFNDEIAAQSAGFTKYLTKKTTKGQ